MTRYMVSSDYYNCHNEWWFDSEEKAREKRAELLASLGERWDVRLERHDVSPGGSPRSGSKGRAV